MSEYSNIGKDFAEGRAKDKLRERATYEHGNQVGLPAWYRYAILEVIYDPQNIDATKLDYWENDLGVSNIKYATVAPRNSIIAVRILKGSNSGAEQPMILWPFFPSHLAFPCKPGEHVWVMFEDQQGTKNDLGFWFCRVPAPNFVDDVNHTHPHRAHDPSFNPGLIDTFEGSNTPVYEFRNGSVGIIEGERFTSPETATISGPEHVYEDIMTSSEAGLMAHKERVPRFRKRPADYVFEGSNNTLIVLGRDRTGPVASYEQDETRGNSPILPLDDLSGDGAGAIDIVAGRGDTEATGGTEVENSIAASELGKSPSELVPDEGDPDFINDRSRVLISQRTRVDSNFGLNSISDTLSSGEVQGSASEITRIEDGPDGEGAIVLKTDKLRLIARSDVEMLVTTYERDESGKIREIEDTSKWAAIAIKANGDIIFRPAEQGFIKLGGDDADKALLCTDLPAIAADGKVDPSTPPIITTMGGQFGGTQIAGQGTWASKVLVVAKKG